jgi:hypothetical protein
VRADETSGPRADPIDNALERLELLAGDDEAIAAYLDGLDVHSSREREMLTELARTTTLASPDRFDEAHRRAVAALESLGRHGYHSFRIGTRLGPLRGLLRFFVELVARYVVVSYLRSTATELRNLYWLREIESPAGARELELLRPARFDAEALTVIFKRREIGLPSFVIGGLLIPIVASAGRLSGLVESAIWAAVIGVVGTAIALTASWIILRGAAMASRRIRVATRAPLEAVWAAVGWCGRPPRDQSRTFAIVAIVLTVVAWIVLPMVIAIALAD